MRRGGMKLIEQLKGRYKKWGIGMSGALLSMSAFATDKLAGAMSGDVQDMLGGSGTFWKVFILVDIILAAAMAVKSKNPMVFVGVFAIALIPGFLINAFVF
jgi:hypothetical protein